MSIQFLSRTRPETEVSVTVDFYRCLASALGFPEAVSSSSLVSTRFCHVLINTIHDSYPRSGSVLKQRLDQNFNTLSIFMTKHFKIREWAGSRILERIHPLARVFFAFRGIEYSRKNWYISCPSSAFKSQEILSLFEKLQTRTRA